jgi:hypothetical protein
MRRLGSPTNRPPLIPSSTSAVPGGAGDGHPGRAEGFKFKWEQRGQHRAAHGPAMRMALATE